MSQSPQSWKDRAAWALLPWRESLSDGELATLGRLAIPDDAMLLPCFARLCNMTFGTADAVGRQLEALARCAFLAGRVLRFEDGAGLATAMAKRVAKDRPAVSAVRAAALFSLEDETQACLAVASVLGILGGRQAARLDAKETVRAMADWTAARRSLALAYHRIDLRQQVAALPIP